MNDRPNPTTRLTVHNSISFSELAERAGVDEDTLLERLAEILNRRPELPPELRDITPRCPASGDPCPANAEIDRLREDCAQAYQAVGAMGNALGWWTMAPEHPWHRPIEKLLDNLSAASSGDPRPHEDLTPFELKGIGNVQS